MEFNRVSQEETDMHHKYQFSYIYTQVSVFWIMSTIWILSFLLDRGLTWWGCKISIKNLLTEVREEISQNSCIFFKKRTSDLDLIKSLWSSFLSARSVRSHRSSEDILVLSYVLSLSILCILNWGKREQTLSYILLDFQQLFKELPFKIFYIHKGTVNKHGIHSMPFCLRRAENC